MPNERIEAIKRTLRKRRCFSYTKYRPKRRIIMKKVNMNIENCILGSSLVYGIFIDNTVTISCPGGQVSTLCSAGVQEELEYFKPKRVIVMCGTNNLYDKDQRTLMLPSEVALEMDYLINLYKHRGYQVALMKLISREGKYRRIKKLNQFYAQIAKWHGIPCFRTRKFSHRRYISDDGLHPSPAGVRELAKDLYDALAAWK